MLFGLIVLWLIAAIVGVRFKAKFFGKLLLLLCIIAALAVPMALGAFVLGISSIHGTVYACIVLVVYLLIIVFSGCALWGVLKKKAVYIPLCICLAACLLTAGSFYLYQRYVDSIPTVGESNALLASYAPYMENSKVAELSEEPTLRLAEELPRLDGATALYPIYSAFAKAVYPKEALGDMPAVADDRSYFITLANAEVLKCSTTTGAYQNIVTGEADMIFVAAPSAEQQQFASDNGVELIYTPIGKEAFVFFVNKKNPISDMTITQIQEIYSGSISDWSALGVEGLGEIKAFQRDAGSGSQSALIRLMDGKALIEPVQEEVIESMGGIIQQTADYKNFKNAIGYSFRFYATEMVRNNQIKLLRINGVAPDIENIENGTYPITDSFYAVTRADMTENTRKLLDWILSEQGKELIKQTGYTPIR